MHSMSRVRRMTESSVLVALAVVLSLIRLVDLPYGGSVTAASMFPLIVLAYRHGKLYGFAGGFLYGGIQLLLGMNTLSYVSGWVSVVAVIVLDFFLAFCVLGVASLFKKSHTPQALSLTMGVFCGCLLRYACHVVSGATVWAGLSIPSKAALLYSLGYNATYMLPETLIVLCVSLYVGNLLDFSAENPKPLALATRLHLSSRGKVTLLVSGAVTAVGVVFIIVEVFSKLQNAENGTFDPSGVALVAWVPTAMAAAVSLLAVAVIVCTVKKGMPNGENLIKK